MYPVSGLWLSETKPPVGGDLPRRKHGPQQPIPLAVGSSCVAGECSELGIARERSLGQGEWWWSTPKSVLFQIGTCYVTKSDRIGNYYCRDGIRAQRRFRLYISPKLQIVTVPSHSQPRKRKHKSKHTKTDAETTSPMRNQRPKCPSTNDDICITSLEGG